MSDDEIKIIGGLPPLAVFVVSLYVTMFVGLFVSHKWIAAHSHIIDSGLLLMFVLFVLSILWSARWFETNVPSVQDEEPDSDNKHSDDIA